MYQRLREFPGYKSQILGSYAYIDSKDISYYNCITEVMRRGYDGYYQFESPRRRTCYL